MKQIELFLKLCDRKELSSILFGLLSAFASTFVEYSFVVYLQFIFVSFGMLEKSTLPGIILPLLGIQPVVLCFGLVLLSIIRSMVVFFSQYFPNYFYESFLSKLRKTISFELLLNEKNSDLDSTQIDLRFSETYPKACGFIWLILNALLTAIQLAIYFVMMCYISFAEAITVVVGLCLAGIFVKQLNSRITRSSSMLPISFSKISNTLSRVSGNRTLVWLYGLRHSENKEIQAQLDDYAKNSTYSRGLATFAAVVPQVAGALIMAILIYIGRKRSFAEAGTFVSFLYLFLRFSQQAGVFATHLGSAAGYFPHFRSTWNTLLTSDQWSSENSPNIEMEFPATSTILNLSTPGIDFRNLSFRWSESSPLLFEKMNLSLDPGCTLGIVGQSGTGKSTLLGLISGIFQPTDGYILIDGLSPKEFIHHMSDRIGYVGPETYLFRGTLRDNLLYGNRESPTDEDIWKVLSELELFEDVNRSAIGLDVDVNDTNSLFSTGQKQRFDLARSLLRKPKLLILDEATSNLDSLTEALIAEKIHKLEGCTKVIISHRTGILKYADVIINLGSSLSIQRDWDSDNPRNFDFTKQLAFDAANFAGTQENTLFYPYYC